MVSARCNAQELVGPLDAKFSHKCSVASNDNAVLKVLCEYSFMGAGEPKLVDIAITYLVTYALSSPQPLAAADVEQFSTANGTLHSWPFVRELLHSLTLRMGIPAFKLGVMHFVPMPVPEKNAPAAKATP